MPLLQVGIWATALLFLLFILSHLSILGQPIFPQLIFIQVIIGFFVVIISVLLWFAVEYGLIWAYVKLVKFVFSNVKIIFNFLRKAENWVFSMFGISKA